MHILGTLLVGNFTFGMITYWEIGDGIQLYLKCDLYKDLLILLLTLFGDCESYGETVNEYMISTKVWCGEANYERSKQGGS